MEEYLKDDYIVLSFDFQQLGTGDFADEETFVQAFTEVAFRAFDIMGVNSEEKFLQPLAELTEKIEEEKLKELFLSLSEICLKARNQL